MMGDFSSLIELCAAIYLTISLDDLLLRRFWTPDYAKDLETGLSSINIPSFTKRNTIEKSRSLSAIEEKRSRKRGGLMFGLSVVLLVIIGFESYMSGLGDVWQSGYLILLLFLEMISYLFDVFFLKSWWRLLKISILIPTSVGIIAVVTLLSDEYYKLVDIECQWITLTAKILLVLTLLLPVLWQLFRNWIYTHYYLVYIINQTQEKANDYLTALSYDHNKGMSINTIASVYHDAVLRTVAIGNGDRPIILFTEILNAELEKIDYVPSLLPLLRYSYASYQMNNPSNRKLRNLVKKYKSCSPLPKIDVFCKNEKVNPTLFRKFFNQNKQG